MRGRVEVLDRNLEVLEWSKSEKASKVVSDDCRPIAGCAGRIQTGDLIVKQADMPAFDISEPGVLLDCGFDGFLAHQ